MKQLLQWILKNTLERLDFKVVSTASDGKEAIQKAEELKPDLILDGYHA